MPAAGTVDIVISRRLALRTGQWLLNWEPDEPTALGGGVDPSQKEKMRRLGEQLYKAGRRRIAPGSRLFRKIPVERPLASAFVEMQPLRSMELVALWPTEVRKMQRRMKAALGAKRGRKRLPILTLRKRALSTFHYSEETNRRRTRRKLREAERRLARDQLFEQWAREIHARGETALTTTVPLQFSP